MAHRYFIGKDNLFFHTIFWPAMLIGAGHGWRLPDDVVANHYLNLGGEQMSASRGHGFLLDDALDALGVDPLRHALCAQNPESSDTEFRYEQVTEATRTGLLGAIANPAFRVATLLWRRFGGRADPIAWTEAGRERAEAAQLLEEAGRAIRAVELRRALDLVHRLGRTVNQTLAEVEPWNLPDPEAHRVLTQVLPYLDALGTAAWPIVPGTAGRTRALLGRPEAPRDWSVEEGAPVVTRAPEPPFRPDPDR